MQQTAVLFFALLLLRVAGASLWSLPASVSSTQRSAPETVVTAPAGKSSVEGPYFSGRDRLAERLLAAINHTKTKLDVAVFDLTHAELTASLEAAHRRGVKIRVLTDQGQAREPNSGVPYLSTHGIPVRVSGGHRGDRSRMHHKFAVFDGKKVATGSFNWTHSADGFNFENLVFISDPETVRRFQEEFERLWGQGTRAL